MKLPILLTKAIGYTHKQYYIEFFKRINNGIKIEDKLLTQDLHHQIRRASFVIVCPTLEYIK